MYEAAKEGGITDEEIYERILQTTSGIKSTKQQGNDEDMDVDDEDDEEEDTFVKARALMLLQDARQYHSQCNTPKECLSYLGVRFRFVARCAESIPDHVVGQHILSEYVLIHCKNNVDKLECLLLMIRKLYNFAGGRCSADNLDSMSNQEILLPGHLMSAIVK